MVLRRSMMIWMSLLCIAVPTVGQEATVSAALPKPGKYFFDSNGVRIHYEVSGKGDPVILIHGYGSAHNLDWWRGAQVLSKDYLVIALDCRGHGKSDKPHDAAAYGDEMALDVVRLMDHLGIEKAHVAGYSMGGFITGKLLVLHPERIRSAVIGGAGWIDVQGRWGEMLDQVAVSLEDGKGAAPLLESLQPTSGPQMPPAQIQAMSRMMLVTNDPKALAQVARGLKTLSVPLETFRKIDLPVLAVVGERDPLKEGADAVSTVIPGIQTIVLEGQDHMTTPFSKPFADAVKAFFDAQR